MALISVMRDAMLRRAEAAALTNPSFEARPRARPFPEWRRLRKTASPPVISNTETSLNVGLGSRECEPIVRGEGINAA